MLFVVIVLVFHPFPQGGGVEGSVPHILECKTNVMVMVG